MVLPHPGPDSSFLPKLQGLSDCATRLKCSAYASKPLTQRPVVLHPPNPVGQNSGCGITNNRQTHSKRDTCKLRLARTLVYGYHILTHCTTCMQA